MPHTLPGRELYAELLTKNEAVLVAPYDALTDNCKRDPGGLCSYKYVPKGELQISQAGLQRAESETLKTPYGYQVSNLRAAYLEDAEIATEHLLKYLWKNKALFDKWISSDAFKDLLTA